MTETGGNGDTVPANRAGGSRAHHDLASAIAFNDEVGEAGEDEVVDRTAGSEDTSEECGDSEGVDEDVAHVIRRDWRQQSLA